MMKRPRLTVQGPRLTMDRPRVTMERPMLAVERSRLTLERPKLTMERPRLTLRGRAYNAKADSTLRSSQAVPHPSTDRALRRLTSEVERDPVHSTWYGRQRNHCNKKFNCLPFCLWGKCFHAGWEA